MTKEQQLERLTELLKLSWRESRSEYETNSDPDQVTVADIGL